MKLQINDNHFINLKLAPTSFAEYWFDIVFSNGSIEIQMTDDAKKNKKEYLHNVDTLSRCLNNVNEAILSLSFGSNVEDELLYNSTNLMTPSFLEKTHEKWADFTKLSREQHKDFWREDRYEQYNAINQVLKEFTIDDINYLVHKLEFQYRHVYTQFKLPSVEFKYREHIITTEDTSFDLDVINVPFNDIGRPQYEKWNISQQATHREISNFEHIVNRIEFRAMPILQRPNPKFIEQCKNERIPVYGNNLPVAQAVDQNTDMIGFKFLDGLSLENNRIFLIGDR